MHVAEYLLILGEGELSEWQLVGLVSDLTTTEEVHSYYEPPNEIDEHDEECYDGKGYDCEVLLDEVTSSLKYNN